MRSALDWLMDQQWSGEGGWSGGMAPSLDMRETEDSFLVELEMPGVRPEDTEVTLDGRVLIVRGHSTREQGDEGQKGRYLVRERQSMSFARAITLPTDVEADRVDCRFENGELMITLPKAAQARSRRIPISTGGGAQGARQVGDREEGGQGQPGSGQQGQQGQQASGQQGQQGSGGAPGGAQGRDQEGSTTLNEND